MWTESESMHLSSLNMEYEVTRIQVNLYNQKTVEFTITLVYDNLINQANVTISCPGKYEP